MLSSSHITVTLPILYSTYFLGVISSQGSGPRSLGIANEVNNNQSINLYMNPASISHSVGFIILCI